MFLVIKKKILNLCNTYEIPKPDILKSDEAPSGKSWSDHITEKCIYLNISKAGDLSTDNDQEYYARHTFIRFLCNLEKIPKYSDYVADVILGWMAIDLINKETTPSHEEEDY